MQLTENGYYMRDKSLSVYQSYAHISDQISPRTASFCMGTNRRKDGRYPKMSIITARIEQGLELQFQ